MYQSWSSQENINALKISNRGEFNTKQLVTKLLARWQSQGENGGTLQSPEIMHLLLWLPPMLLEPVIVCHPHYCHLLVPDPLTLPEVIVTHSHLYFLAMAPAGTRSRKTTPLVVLGIQLKCFLLGKLNRNLSEREFRECIF